MIDQQRYLEALARSAHVPIIWQLDIGTAYGIVSMLQLALRHPRVASGAHGGAAKDAREVIRQFQEQLAGREPLLAELVELGNRPQADT